MAARASAALVYCSPMASTALPKRLVLDHGGDLGVFLPVGRAAADQVQQELLRDGIHCQLRARHRAG